MKIVTSGSAYIDIDAYSGCIAYAELLRLQGFEAKAVCTAPWNESICKSVREWNADLETTYTKSPDDTFVIIDVSDPNHFETFVDIDRIQEVIDHHPGFEKFWEERIGTSSHIEFIGSVCTQISEMYKDAGLLPQMTTTCARLLIAGILDNTLNFCAKVTTERDKSAYMELLKLADLPNDWTAQYFTDCQEAILADVKSAIQNDAKTLTFSSLPGTLGVGQLVVWDAQKVLNEHGIDIEETLAMINPKWFMNLVNISERASYFLAKDENVQVWLSNLLHVQFIDGVAKADRLWLRKEILKADIGQGASAC
jgi:inorganic pyrophosphatase/exopolyphosphatase